jgi:hypothetical protein
VRKEGAALRARSRSIYEGVVIMNRKLVCTLLLLGAAHAADAAPTLPLPPPSAVADPAVLSRPIGAIVANADI